jgi:hypothetical protein
MSSPLTVRQQILKSLEGALYSARDLAHLYAIPEREVEEHLTHIIRTIARKHERSFVVQTAHCEACGYVFRGRTRVTRPGRCPQCRSEHITAPRFGIEHKSLDRLQSDRSKENP